MRERRQTQPSDGGATALLADKIVATRFDDVPDDVVSVAKHCILDCLGAGFRGSEEPVARLVRETLAAGRKPSSGSVVLGTAGRLPPHDAAIANGTSCHALDYDDTQPDLEGHPSAPVLAALLADGESRGATGRAFLTAFVAGVECECLLGSLLNPSHYAHGWHATATLGRFGAAAACARLEELPTAATRHALGLAGAQAAGLKSSFGTMAKPFQVGKAAGDGLLSALLAARGVTANAAIVEAPSGLQACYAGGREALDSLLVDGTYRLRSVLFKFHAACHMLHPMLSALENAVRGRPPAPAEIDRVELHLTHVVLEGCPIDNPTTGLETTFSPRGAAALFLSGHPTGAPESFRDDALQTAEFREILDRIEVVAVVGRDDWNAEVRIRTVDGHTASAAGTLDGSAGEVLAAADPLLRKFRSLSEPVIGAEQTERLHSLVMELETVPDVRELAVLCTTPPNGAGETRG